MTEEEIKIMVESSKDVDKLSNKSLESNMDKLATEFEETKKNIINMTYYLDRVEQLYDVMLKEHKKRNG